MFPRHENGKVATISFRGSWRTNQLRTLQSRRAAVVPVASAARGLPVLLPGY